MLKKTYYLAAVVAAMFLAGSASAIDYNWIGGVGDWDVGANWAEGTPPTPDSGNVLSITGTGDNVTIPAGYTATVGIVGNTHPPFNFVFGPEFGAKLNIYGTLLYDWYVVPVQFDSLNRGELNMYGDSYLAGEGIGLGYTWFYNGGPYADMNMSGNSYAAINFMFWGGRLLLHDNAIMDIAIGVADGTEGAVSDGTRDIRIFDDAKLLLPAGFEGTVSSWVTRGIIHAGVPGEYILTDSTMNPGRTTVYTSSVPEPSSLALLGMGGLLGAGLLRRRSNT